MGKARHAFSPWGWEFLEARVGLGVSTQEAVRVLRILPLQGSGTPRGQAAGLIQLFLLLGGKGSVQMSAGGRRAAVVTGSSVPRLGVKR